MASEKAAADFQLEKEIKRHQEAQVCSHSYCLFTIVGSFYLLFWLLLCLSNGHIVIIGRLKQKETRFLVVHQLFGMKKQTWENSSMFSLILLVSTIFCLIKQVWDPATCPLLSYKVRSRKWINQWIHLRWTSVYWIGLNDIEHDCLMN